MRPSNSAMGCPRFFWSKPLGVVLPRLPGEIVRAIFGHDFSSFFEVFVNFHQSTLVSFSQLGSILVSFSHFLSVLVSHKQVIQDKPSRKFLATRGRWGETTPKNPLNVGYSEISFLSWPSEVLEFLVWVNHLLLNILDFQGISCSGHLKVLDF